MNLGFWNFYPFYNNNKMFEEATAPGAGDDLCHSLTLMAHFLRERGHQVNTLDRGSDFDSVVFLDHPTFWNRRFRALRNTRTKLYLFLLENEVNRPDNYWKFFHRDFEKVFTWNPDLVDNKKYFQFYHTFKVPRNLTIDLSIKDRFCLTISSQKYSTHPRALYRERVGIIRWFEREHPDQFDLYGQRWDRFYFNNHLWRLNILLARLYQRYPKRFQAPKLFPSFRGPVPRKHEVMRRYKYAVVFENAVIPGYLTEKIFDAFFAGCIPIYLGAPDVLKYLPPETFIDARAFANYEELYKYLIAMPEKEYRQRIDAIEKFVNSEAIKPYTADGLIELVMEHIVPASEKTKMAQSPKNEPLAEVLEQPRNRGLR